MLIAADGDSRRQPVGLVIVLCASLGAGGSWLAASAAASIGQMKFAARLNSTLRRRGQAPGEVAELLGVVRVPAGDGQDLVVAVPTCASSVAPG